MSLLKEVAFDKYRSEIPAAVFERILDRHPVTHEPYPNRTLYPSSLYDITAEQFVRDFYQPVASEDNWRKTMYTSHGHAAEVVIQRALFLAGVLICPHGEFKETRVYCPELGISGRTDSIAWKEGLLHMGAVKFQGRYEPSPDHTQIIIEIKETGSSHYSMIDSPASISTSHQWAQAAYQMILGIPETCFLYVNRDTMALKTIFFRSAEVLQKEIRQKCEFLWDCVKEKRWPDPENKDQWVYLETGK